MDLNHKIATLTVKSLDPSEYKQWTSEQIVAWIINIDKTRYDKYKDLLLYHLRKEGVIGADLNVINEVDLQRWQIINFQDKKVLRLLWVKPREFRQRNRDRR